MSCGIIASGTEWLSWYSVRLAIKGLLVRNSTSLESFCCVLEHDMELDQPRKTRKSTKIVRDV